MAFLDLFRSKWKHSDVDVRLAAVRDIDATDEKVLAEVIRGDRDDHVRRVAIKKVENPRLLLALAKDLEPAALRTYAEERAAELLLHDAIQDDDDDTTDALAAVALLSAPRDLAAVARRAVAGAVRKAAVARLAEPKLLAELAVRADDGEVQTAALARLTDPAGLADVALLSEEKRIALAALGRVNDRVALAKIASDARNRMVRLAARERLPADPAAPSKAMPATPSAPRVDKVRKAQQLALCMAAENAANRDAPDSEMAELRTKWHDHDGDEAKPALRERFAAAFVLHARRKKEHEEAAHRKQVAAEIAAQRLVAAKAAAVKTAADAEAAAAKAAADAAAAAEAAARLPPPPVVVAKVEPTAAEKLTAMCVEAERGLRHADRAAALEERFRAADPGGDDLAALRERFNAALEASASRRREVEERARVEREEMLAIITNATKALTTAAAGDRRHALDRALKESQPVESRARTLNGADVEPIRAALVAARAAATARLTELVEAEKWKQWANLPKLEELCKEAEALAEIIASVEDKRRTPQVLAELRQRWKNVTVPPSDRQKALWERFKKACDAVHEQSREFFSKLGDDSAEAAAAKEALCVAVEALVDLPAEDWQATSEKIIALQGEWKNAGHVAGEKGEALWKRFRAACDKFFARREELDKSRDADREANLAKAESICTQLEALSTSTEWRATADAIKALQQEWRDIGELPRGKSGPLWKRFRAACDTFFDARKAAFDVEEGARAENLAKKEALCVRAETLAANIPEDPEAARSAALELQAEWKTVGHVPREAQETVWKRFREASDKVFEAIRTESAPAAESAPAVERSERPERPTEAPPSSPPTGLSGFVNRLPLDKLIGKLPKASGKKDAAAKKDAAPAAKPAPTAKPDDSTPAK